MKRLKEKVEGDRSGWDRFAIIKANAQKGRSMYPRTMPGAILLLDRHCNSLTPYRKGNTNIYAVRKDQTCTIEYVETAHNHLTLRLHNPAYSIEVITLEDGQKPSDYIVGRVCYLGIET